MFVGLCGVALLTLVKPGVLALLACRTVDPSKGVTVKLETVAGEVLCYWRLLQEWLQLASGGVGDRFLGLGGWLLLVPVAFGGRFGKMGGWLLLEIRKYRFFL